MGKDGRYVPGHGKRWLVAGLMVKKEVHGARRRIFKTGLSVLEYVWNATRVAGRR